MDDSVLSFVTAMAGNGEKVHSLRISVPVVNHSEEESRRVFKALSAVFEAVYPDWPMARDWPVRSAQEAWRNHPIARKTPLADPNDVFVRRSEHGITSTTFGVPPDIVIYTITVRERCIPVREQGNPFTRLVC